MILASLKDILDRAQAWPEENQEQLMRAAQLIETQQAGTISELDDADWAIIDSRLEDARRGGLATGQEVTALFAKHRAV